MSLSTRLASLKGLLRDSVSAPVYSLTEGTSGSLSAGAVNVRVSAVTENGETIPGARVSKTVSASAKLTIAIERVPDVRCYRIYASSASGTETYQGALAPFTGISGTYTLSALVTGSAMPTGDTATLYVTSAGYEASIADALAFYNARFPRILTSEILLEPSSDINFIKAGLLPGSSSDTLTSEISAGIAYIAGVKITVGTNTSKSYTANKDTYVDLTSAGAFTLTEKTIGADPPDVSAGSIRLAKVVSGSASLTITDLRELSGFLYYEYPSDWEEGFSAPIRFEYPIGSTPPELLKLRDEVYFGIEGFRFPNLAPESTEYAILTSAVRNAIGASTDTIPVNHSSAFDLLAASYACERTIPLYVHNSNKQISADTVDYESRPRNFKELAKDYRLRAFEILGLDTEGNLGSSVFAEIGIYASHSDLPVGYGYGRAIPSIPGY